MEALHFRLNDDLFAVDLAEVDEMLMMATLRALPDAPAFLAGVLNLRNEMLPVVDLSQRLGYHRPEPPPPVNPREERLLPYRRDTRMLVTTAAGLRMALIVDGMEEILSYPEEALRPGLLRDGAQGACLDRLAVHGGKVVQLVRLRNALSEAERALLRTH